MAERIKGITVEIGGNTTGLNKALAGTNKEISSTQTELKKVERLLKIDPHNVELLEQKQRLLTQAVSETKDKVDMLRTAEKQVHEQFKQGKISQQQYDAFKRTLIEAEQQANKAEAALSEFNREAKKVDAGKQFDDVASAADDMGDSIENAEKKTSHFGDYLKAGVIVEGAKAIVSGLKDVAEESKEYLKIMGSLKMSSKKAGYTADQTYQSYKELYGVLGDDQTAATTTANLQALKLSQKDLNKVIKGTIGAWATYGDSIPIDGLAESINETVKTGKVTGTFADVLNWAGTSEDEFNKKLEKSSSQSERANIVLKELTDQGLIRSGEAWEQNNKALFDNNQANADLQDQLGKLGEKVLPILTDITNAISDMLDWFNDLSPEVQDVIGFAVLAGAALGPISGLIEGIADAQWLLNGAVSGFPLTWLLLALAAIAGMITWIVNNWDDTTYAQWWDQYGDDVKAIWDSTTFGQWWDQYYDEFCHYTDVMKLKMEQYCLWWNHTWRSIKDIFSGVWDEITEFYTTTIPNAWQGLVNIFNGVGRWWSNIWNGVKLSFSNAWNFMKNSAKSAANGVIGVLNGIIGGINSLIEKVNGISFSIPSWIPGIGGKSFGMNIRKLGHIAYLAKGGILSQGSAVVGENGPELLTMLGNRAMVQPLSNNSTTTNNSFGEITVNVYSNGDASEIAEQIATELQYEVQRKGMVFA